MHRVMRVDMGRGRVGQCLFPLIVVEVEAEDARKVDAKKTLNAQKQSKNR